MKKCILASGVMSACVMLSSCAVDTTTSTYSPEYSGYTVGYVGSNIDDRYVGYGGYGGGYVGYGGWASNYYSPGHRYYSWSGAYGGHGSNFYRSGYAGRGWRR